MKMAFKVKGMHCSACEKLLQMEIGAIEGVKSVKANAATGAVEVQGDAFDAASVKKAITGNGYKVQ
jgi:copper chaperone CopZ